VLCGESGDRRGVGDELRVIEDDKGVDMPIVPGRKCACILRPEVLIAGMASSYPCLDTRKLHVLTNNGFSSLGVRLVLPILKLGHDWNLDSSFLQTHTECSC
jgi:hypothetical protein